MLCLTSGTESTQNQLLTLRAICLNMTVKKNSTKTIDLSNFLCALKLKLSIIRGVPFGFNTQQFFLDELKGISIAFNL